MVRKLLIGALGAISVVIVLAAAIAGFAAYSYSRDMRIDSANGINEAGYVKIGGIDQWIQVRGHDRDNPVLLLLNGGPGFSLIPSTHAFRSWEEHFNVVMWDPRGQGKTFERSGTSVANTMTIAQMVSDGIEVAEHLHNRLHKDKIVLVGFSWGSIMGVPMVQRRPDLFSVYVGTGQVVHEEKGAEISYPLVIERARKLGNDAAVQQLIAAGPPPYGPDVVKWIPLLVWANELDPNPNASFARSPGELWLLIQPLFGPQGFPPDAQFSQLSLWGEISAVDLPALGLKFDVPVVIIQGTEDIVTPTSLAKEYFDAIEAPSKQFSLVPGFGHLAFIRASDAFLRALLDHARPPALQSDGPDGAAQ